MKAHPVLVSRLLAFRRAAGPFALLALLFAPAIVVCAEPAPTPAHKTRIVLVGDSTVTDHAGWGLGFKQFVDDRTAECINTAQGGRSSKSFIAEGRWTQALALKADYYLIQFGHNDQPGKGPDRETDPATTFTTNMARYVDEARAAGATPILVTSLTRRNFDPAHPAKILSTLTPYVEAVKKLAAEKHVPLVDLHARSIAFCENLGPEKTATFNPAKPNNESDSTHLDARGSSVFAALVVDELRSSAPALASFLLPSPKSTDTASLPTAASPGAPARTPPDAIVSADGSGTHRTVQAAIDAAPVNNTKPFVILIKPGRYPGHVLVPPDRPFITLRGEETAATTLITDGNNVGSLDPDGKKLSTPASATVLVQAASFTAENIAFENTTTREQRIQALALYITGDRASFRQCRFLGWQDTLRADSPRDGAGARQYFSECYIEGHVDFIYSAGIAVFDRCHIHCLADGYITAASTAKERPFGYAFLDCRVTTGPAVEKGVYLGRPWRPYAATAFIRTDLPATILPAGWHNWGKAENETTARYSEYKNTGPGATPSTRAPWSHQLSDDEAKTYTVENILGGPDHWNPSPK